MAHKQEMNLPEWMPPLPEKRRRFFCTKCGSSECTPDTVKDKHPLCVCGYLGFGEDCDYNDDEMRDYGRQCVEDYKKSLKPWTLEGTAEELRAAAYRAGAEAMRERAQLLFLCGEAADEIERLRASERSAWNAAVERDEQIERLRSQLPAEMQDCTIIFKECEKGHGRLTATNWVQHECQTCEIERFRSAYAGACVEMHGFLMDCGLTDCGFGTAKDWHVKASAAFERLRAEVADHKAAFNKLNEMLASSLEDRDRLRARIDAVREIYAGMEGFIAQTAPEGYLQRIVKQMYDAALGGEGK